MCADERSFFILKDQKRRLSVLPPLSESVKRLFVYKHKRYNIGFYKGFSYLRICPLNLVDDPSLYVLRPFVVKVDFLQPSTVSRVGAGGGGG